MTTPRIYFPENLTINSKIQLDENASNHVVRVLRLKVGETIILFNGKDNAGKIGEYVGKLIAIEKKNAVVLVEKFLERNSESPLKIHLLQGIARGEKMDLVIQKAVELGVNAITPIFTEFCNVKLPEDRLQKRLEHWQGVAQHAAEQSGRILVPQIYPAQNLAKELENASPNDFCLTLDPTATSKVNSIASELKNKTIKIFIGPEGGFSDHELNLFQQHNFHFVQLGPRILRTETAALVAITMLQAYLGDF